MCVECNVLETLPTFELTTINVRFNTQSWPRRHFNPIVISCPTTLGVAHLTQEEEPNCFYIMGQFLAWGTSGDHWKIWISLQVFLNHLLEMNIELVVRLFSAACSVHPYPVLIILSLYWSDLLKTMMCYCNGNATLFASSFLCHFTLPQTAEIKGCSLAEQGQGLEIWVKSGYRMYV